MQTQTNEDLMIDLLGDVAELSVEAIGDALHDAECTQTPAALVSDLADIEQSLLALLKNVRKIQKQAARSIAQ